MWYNHNLFLDRQAVKDGQFAAGLKFGDPRVAALLCALCLFPLVPAGFTNSTLRKRIAELLGEDPDTYRPGAMTYDLRRLRLHGFIERIPKASRSVVTQEGLRIAQFIADIADNNSESKLRTQLYLRMFLFALNGFALFFGGAWLRLIQADAMKVASNPYAGPPPLPACLFCGGFGIIFGAVVGLFKRKR